MLGPTEGVIRWDRPNEASAIDMLLTNLNTGSNTFLSELSLDSFTTDLIPSGTNFRVRARSICPIDFSDPHKAQVKQKALSALRLCASHPLLFRLSRFIPIQPIR